MCCFSDQVLGHSWWGEEQLKHAVGMVPVSSGKPKTWVSSVTVLRGCTVNEPLGAQLATIPLVYFFLGDIPWLPGADSHTWLEVAQLTSNSGADAKYKNCVHKGFVCFFPFKAKCLTFAPLQSDFLLGWVGSCALLYPHS